MNDCHRNPLTRVTRARLDSSKVVIQVLSLGTDLGQGGALLEDAG
jgi:hypothetical protein